jgi:hypothetical protein
MQTISGANTALKLTNIKKYDELRLDECAPIIVEE